MLGLLKNTQKIEKSVLFGSASYNIQQKRWKKPVDSAQTRLETRTIDHKLDKLVTNINKLKKILKLYELMSKARDGYTSVQIISRWRNIVGINVPIGEFLRKYPHVFQIYKHPTRKNLCCKVSDEFKDLVLEEGRIVKESEAENVKKFKKLLMMSTSGTLHAHALWLMRRELGLPDDFRSSIINSYSDDFRLVYSDIVALSKYDDCLANAEVEKWRYKEFTDKWLSEYETKYAFPANFPTGYKIEKGFREKLKNWQRLNYVKPYEKIEGTRVRSYGGTDRFEKRAIGILHECLSLTVEKLVEVERLAHFRRDFNMDVNVRELLLKHPGIFYISTKGNTQTVFLREAYMKGCLVEPNSVYSVRRKMLDLILLGGLGMKQTWPSEEEIEESCDCFNLDSTQLVDGGCEEGWVISNSKSSDEQVDVTGISLSFDFSSDEE